MSILINYEELLKGEIVESSRIELKEDWNPDPIIHTICAFANDIDNIGGGYLLIGVKEKDGLPVRPVSGLRVETLDSIQKELTRCCNFIEPRYLPQIDVVKIDGQYVLVIRVAGGSGRPYRACEFIPKKKGDPSRKNESHEKRYYIRKGSKTVVASIEEERELFYISSSIPFDDRPNLSARLEDLSLERMKEHLRITNSSLPVDEKEPSLLELAEDLQLVEGPAEDLRPRNVGILMFGKDPQKFFRYARIELVWIPSPDGMGMEEQIFQGPLQNQLQDALNTIQGRFLKEKIIKHTAGPSSRIWNYPYRAIQEILANAIYHKSYQIFEPITIRITETEIEITSHPGFDRSIRDIDIDQQRIRSRTYRNRRIGDFLKELHLVEERNTGFPNAQKALQENGSPALKLVMDEEREYLSVILSVHPAFLPEQKVSAKEIEYRKKILAQASDQPVTLSFLARKMGYKGITARLSRTVNELILEGSLEKVIQNGKILIQLAKKEL